jgi:ABC-type protease/lipase transport system fused ATPase/permease subunit
VVGYLPQDVSLLDATIAENIARLADDAPAASIVAAAQEAAVHDMIVRMPDGYQAAIGPQGIALSGGERQRIGLARALFGKPFLVVLDEPNSNLDAEGEAALTSAIQSVKKRGGIVVVIAHRPSALAAVDLIAVVQNGKLTAFGPKEEVLNPKVAPTAAEKAAPPVKSAPKAAPPVATPQPVLGNLATPRRVGVGQ